MGVGGGGEKDGIEEGVIPWKCHISCATPACAADN